MLDITEEEQHSIEEILSKATERSPQKAAPLLEEYKASDRTGEKFLRIFRLIRLKSGFEELEATPGTQLIAIALLVRHRAIQDYETQAQQLSWNELDFALKDGTPWQIEAICNQLHKSALAGMFTPTHPTPETNPLETCFTDWDTLTLTQQVERAITFADYMVEHDC